MNGQSGTWAEATNADGRIYFYHTTTKATQWTKPLELMSPAERAVANQPWKEYTAEGGRKYYSNAETKETMWEMPEVLRAALAQVKQTQTRPAAPQFVAGGGNSFHDSHRPRDRERDRDDYPMQDVQTTGRQSGYGISTLPSQNEPDYATLEEAEGALFKLFKKVGAQPDWTWEQAMRATVKDPQYRAIKDPKDRRSAFDKYATQARVAEKEREKERQAKLRNDFTNMLRTHPEVTYYTRWISARPIIEKETLFRAAKDEDERIALFNDYRSDLYKEYLEQEAMNRKVALDQLTQLLGSLDLEPYTRWSEAQSIIQTSDQFQADDTFKSLTKIDIVKTFESHIKALERRFNDNRQEQKSLKARRERQNRDRFMSLLRDLKVNGKIKAGTKWMTVHPLIEDDPRYVAMLGQSGSTPLDLFWDVIEEEERDLRAKRNEVLDTLDDKRFEITPKTTLDEFLSVMETDSRTAKIEKDSLNLIFERLREKVLRRNDEDKHQAERQQRRAVDALRSRIKHLEPPVAVGDTWEQVRSRVEKLEEYRSLDSDELRRSAYDKVMRRLKEKEEEYEKEHSRRDHDHRDRERDRGHRNGHSKRHRTRTPEVDAYEADRRKAMADRERNYGKKGVASFSPPPPRARDRDGRGDRYDGRSRRQLSATHNDRDRRGRDRDPRDRENERERSYVSRADPRERASELDYGDSRPSSLRKRRDSEESPLSVRDSKRLRRDRLSRERTNSPRTKARSKTPQVAPPKEDPGLRSGSEEGEIEED